MDLRSPDLVSSALGLDDGSRRQSLGVVVRCPWHDDRRPSCSITTAADGALRVKCFACGASGDVFTLIAKVCGLDLKAQFPAVLAEGTRIATMIMEGVPFHVDSGPTADADQPREPATLLLDQDFDHVARAVLSVSTLEASPDVSAYLAGRGLLQEARADEWAALPADGDDQSAAVERVVEAVGMEAWSKSGLCSDSGALKFRSNRLVIPWRNGAGQIVSLQRRVIDHRAPKYVFPDGRGARVPYGLERAALNGPPPEVAFVEGAVDVLAYRALCRGRGRQRLVLGVPGVSNWRAAWAVYGRDRVAHVALDADDAGERAVHQIARDLYDAGAVRVLRTRPNGAKDWAELLAKRPS